MKFEQDLAVVGEKACKGKEKGDEANIPTVVVTLVRPHPAIPHLDPQRNHILQQDEHGQPEILALQAAHSLFVQRKIKLNVQSAIARSPALQFKEKDLTLNALYLQK